MTVVSRHGLLSGSCKLAVLYRIPFPRPPIRRVSTAQIPQDIVDQLDLKKPLANSINRYTRHFSVSTGQYNWPATPREDVHYGPDKSGSREGGAFELSQFVVNWAKALKPNKNILYTKSSHASQLPCVHVYPDNVKITFKSEIPSFEQVQEFQSQWMLSSEPRSLDFITIEKLPEDTIHIYICCHAARDQRCGVIGPMLLSDIRKYIISNPRDVGNLGPRDVQVFGCSHVGGHKFAGNMVIYRSGWRYGVWYGRVSPQDVPEIMQETVIGERILGRHWRGGLPSGDWDPDEHISGEDAEQRSLEWRDKLCGCKNFS
jgi:(2Fe-2S) ferredoxin